MKILLLSDSYSPMVNGVVTSVRTLQSGLIAQGHDVRVITPGDARTSSFDGDVYRLASIGIGAIYPGARLARPTDRKVLTSICEWGPDILHSHTEFTAYLWARRLTRHTNAPHVHTYHTVYEDYTHYFSPSEKVGKGAVAIGSRHMMGATDLVISPTRKVKGLLDGYGVTTPVAVIPTGINLTRFTSSLGHTELGTTDHPRTTPTDAGPSV
ncbi:glycosyltransferase family 4 protein, partial [Dermatophilus congolensis]|nr:glycosyltransferase family 4 protein [Dermatophilus congolensis]